MPAHFHFSTVPNTFRDYIDAESLTGYLRSILQLSERNIMNSCRTIETKNYSTCSTRV